MEASILAIGPFSSEIADHLNYPAEQYRTTKPGASIVVELFGIVEGTHTGKAFAAQLGISDPFDFNQHKIDPTRIDAEGIKRVFAKLGSSADYLRDLDRLLILRSNNFEFYFRPGH